MNEALVAAVGGPVVEPIRSLPPELASEVRGATWRAARGAISGARVDLLRWDDGRLAFLKSATGDPADPESVAASLVAEHVHLAWLAAQLPVPAVRAFVVEAAATYLLTDPAPGTPATEPDHHQDPDALVVALADGLRRMHELPLAGFSGPIGYRPRLDRARTRVERGLVDPADFEPAYARYPPDRLLELLRGSTPPADEDLVVVHGDPTLANLLLGPGADGRPTVTGYVDVDRAGVADRYLDLAIAARSLATHVSPEVLGPFFHAYGIEAPDLLKVDFYVLLDEFT